MKRTVYRRLALFLLVILGFSLGCLNILGIDEPYELVESDGGGGIGGSGGAECVAETDCAGTDDACKTRTCKQGKCGVDFTPEGTTLSAQTAGDCQKSECDGAGNVVSVADDADAPPDDDNACTSDTCVAGVPSHPSKPAGTPCPADDNPCTQDICAGSGTCAHPAAPDGTSCGVGLVCNVGGCASGCVIDGTFYAAGTTHPANLCEACTPASSTSVWSPKADGTAACAFGGVCGAGACVYDSIPIAYIKASNTGADDAFGYSVALSGDGNTLAVGAYGEASSATGINGNQANNSVIYAGAVYVFTRSGGVWSQQAYIKASNTGASDLFGYSVALSGDGNTLAVGASQEDSNATGINGNQADNSAFGAGAVYVFARSGGVWSQQAYIKASNTGDDDAFGYSVALSGDGHTLAVDAIGEDSSATGINGNQADNSADDAGAVYVY